MARTLLLAAAASLALVPVSLALVPARGGQPFPVNGAPELVASADDTLVVAALAARAGALRGSPVRGAGGTPIGTVTGILTNPAGGPVALAVAPRDGGAARIVMLRDLRAEADGLRVALTGTRLADLPRWPR